MDSKSAMESVEADLEGSARLVAENWSLSILAKVVVRVAEQLRQGQLKSIARMYTKSTLVIGLPGRVAITRAIIVRSRLLKALELGRKGCSFQYNKLILDSRSVEESPH